MQLNEKHLTKEDTLYLGYVPSVPSHKELFEAEREEWDRNPHYISDKFWRLKRINYAYQLYFKHSSMTEEVLSEVRDNTRFHFCHRVWGMDNKPLFIEYPETWWDAFKNRWFSDALLRRYPTNWIEWNINSHTLFPMLEIDAPDDTHTLEYISFKKQASHWDRVKSNVRLGIPEYKPYPSGFWQKFVQFVKDCIPQ